jgi:3-hydroxymyristoyl/3-hydroxydecanoyl-(acyl carrier protein) dehydratase/malonyl CoA-acyl carrier protein transacylase
MVLVGMGCDAEVARYGARWRAPVMAERPDPDAFAPVLESATVIGTMPNIIANRLNAHLDLAGPSFTVSAEEASGLVALDLAARALRTGEADAAVVGAVDLSHEPVHRAAVADLGLDREPGDAAVVLVVKRLADARRDGDSVIALLDEATTEAADLRIGADGYDPAVLFGTPHATAGLLAVAVAALALRHRAMPRAGAAADPAFGVRTADVVVTPLEAPQTRVRLRADAPNPWVAEAPPRLHVFSGRDRTGALAALAAERESPDGPARLVIVAADSAEFAARADAARTWLDRGGPQPDGVAFRAAPLTGEVGFVFSGGLAAYPGMGRELLLAFSDVVDDLTVRCGSVRDAAGWAFDGPDSGPREVLDQIWGTALLSQVHATISRDVLGLTPRAALGYSAGESNALVALGAWTDLRALMTDVTESGMFSRQVAGEFEVIRRSWRRQGIPGTRWKNYLVGADADRVRKALDGEVATHLIAVNAPDSCIIGGEATACERALSRLDAMYTLPIPYELAVHAPELADVRDEWWRLHHRPTTPPPGVRFYSCATTGSYLPTAERAADALTAQAVGTMDFAGTVEQAWADGVRVFVEHGPKGLCTDWIRRTLGDREHLAIALDAPDGRSVRQLVRVAAELVAAGVPVDAAALLDQLESAWAAPDRPARVITLPAHPPEVTLPAVASPTATMARAPQLPPVPPTSDAAMEPAPQPEPPAPHTAAPTVAAAPGHPPVTGGHRPGPAFDRTQLEHLATGRISDLFGPLFAAQDSYRRQTRMPAPPMLLADRVTGIDAVPASMGTGTVWTETDVEPGSWYLDSTGRMPAGILVEAGQADLLLISWLGADLRNQGERVYRLLGCELTFHGSPPLPGDTLRYEIHIDDHAELGGVRLFFFHYDCYVGDELRLSVRRGQAGFFTDAELAATAGVLWNPEPDPPPAPVDPCVVVGAARRYDAEAVRAFAEGRPYDCFGAGWEMTRAHVRTPRIDDGRMLLLGEVVDVDPAGGPWRRGYLRAETPVTPDDWFFAGHFHHDPCMPGTLMFQGCLQAMAFYLAAGGHTVGNDGWRFEPVPGEHYDLRCRGQVTPDSSNISYEVFVRELVAGPVPTLYADVLCTVDGVRAFHARRVGLRLVPDWPLEQWRDLELRDFREDMAVAESDGVRFGYESLLACAWGRPSAAFGELYSRFDSHRRVPRLPGPPYHFMSRVVAIEGRFGGMEVGSAVVAEYDVPDRCWFWEQNGHETMPLAVLMEVGLQPCGWLASYVGCAVEIDKDLLFRNLDGTAAITGEVIPDTKVVRTRATLRDISVVGTMIIVSFDVECLADGVPVFRMDTVFGFFPPEAFADQPGLPASHAQRAALAAPTGPVVDLTTRPAKYCAGPLRLAGPMLLMLDRVTGYDATGGEAGLGRLTADKDVDAGEWFFQAHFFQDPVQPGSLGVEAMYQLLQFYLIERDAGAGMVRPRFQPLTGAQPLVWKYRGQVTPTHGRITTELEITAVGEDADGRYAWADASLWVDGRRIYHAVGIGMRVVAGPPQEETLDPAADTWLADHRPTWTVPVLPMMSVLDRLAAAAGAPAQLALRNVELRRWIPAARPVRLVTGADPGGRVTLSAWRDATTPALSRFEPVASAVAGVPGQRPPALEPIVAGQPVTDFYTSGSLFHGPSFQYLKTLRRGAGCASGVLDAGTGTVPRGALHQGLLDAATHVIPHDRMCDWWAEIPPGEVAYPHRVTSFEQFEPLPDTGEVRVEARFAGFDRDDRRFPVVDLQLVRDDRVLVALRLVEVLMPTGSFGDSAPAQRRVFLRDRGYAGGLGISTTEDGVTWLTVAAVEQCDWLAGTVAHAYGLPAGARGSDHLVRIAVGDHVGRLARVHPSAVRCHDDLRTAEAAGKVYRIQVDAEPDAVTVRS